MFEMSKKGGTDKPADSGLRSDTAPRSESMTARPSSAGREHAMIGASIHIDGDLRGEEDLLIEGEVNGTVQLKNNSLTIGPQGKVRADVYAQSIIVDGYMEGDLYGSERVAIRKNAQVRGNVTSPRVSLEEGAKFKGAIDMEGKAADKPRPLPVPETKSVAPSPTPVEPAAKGGIVLRTESNPTRIS